MATQLASKPHTSAPTTSTIWAASASDSSTGTWSKGSEEVCTPAKRQQDKWQQGLLCPQHRHHASRRPGMCPAPAPKNAAGHNQCMYCCGMCGRLHVSTPTPCLVKLWPCSRLSASSRASMLSMCVGLTTCKVYNSVCRQRNPLSRLAHRPAPQKCVFSISLLLLAFLLAPVGLLGRGAFSGLPAGHL